ncbi:trypsin-like serine protease [Methylobacterium sp. WL6]|uniref:trypsin-like serine protease n=1 Tax=Methylobacterium sp. WL6 TaxID=2603901 RepID=UPI001FEEC201|nr:trypsin-like serine protease [Methylobacterium sp. WL6]
MFHTPEARVSRISTPSRAGIRPALRHLASRLAVPLLALASGSAPAAALEGGAAGRSGDALAQATVGLGTVTAPEDGLHLSRCTGVLIAPDLILTAAHCVNGDPLGSLVVFFRGSEPVKPVRTARVIARYSPDPGQMTSNVVDVDLNSLSLDLAVLRLAEPVRDRVPVPLATDPSRVPRSLRVAGTGVSGRVVGRLRTAILTPVAASSTGLTIARVNGGRVCFGDSGGPVVGQDRRGVFVWGVASAVLSRQAPCGSLVVIAPAAQVFTSSGMR